MDEEKQSSPAEEVLDTSTVEAEESDDTELEDMLDDDFTSDTSDDDDSEDEDTEETEEESTEVVEEASETKEEEETEVTEEDTNSDDTRERAKQAWLEREAKRKAKLTSEQREYVNEEGLNDDQKVIRQLQVDAYNNKVASNTKDLESGIEKALTSIELFKTGTPAIKQKMLDAVDTFERLHVVKNEIGDPIEVTGDVYEYLANEAKSIEALIAEGARKQAKDIGQTKSKAMPKPTAKPTAKEVDKDIDDFDKAWE